MTRNLTPDPLIFSRREVVRLIAAGLLGGTLPACGNGGSDTAMTAPVRAHVPADGLLSASATNIARAIRLREISAEELAKAFLQRIEAINPQINAIVHLRAEDAIADARRADQALAAGQETGPLHGVPMTLKDSIDTAGVTTTYGSLGRSNFVPERDATVAARLKAAGAILLGKTNTPEMTLSFETDNLVYGRTKNPFDPARSPGGSSGGAAGHQTHLRPRAENRACGFVRRHP
jgi:amidase